MLEQVLNHFCSDKALREDCIAMLPFPAVLPDKRITRAEAKAAIDGLRAEAAELPEMTLAEINAEISAARAERESRTMDSL